MTAPRLYVVTPRTGEPYRVALSPAVGRATDGGGAGWRVEVTRVDERWTFDLAPGAAEGLLWSGTRPLRWRWDPAQGRVVLNGEAHDVTVVTETAHRLASLGGRGPTAARVMEIQAPMPGLVIAVEVEEGQSVAAGQGIVVIEAMKMENEITAPAAGRVRAIAVAPGEAVERGALLCRIEPPEEAS
jgi:biotin carboxyl carrier protein